MSPTPTDSPISWLLDGGDPSVRYFTLTELLGSSPDSPEAAAARCDIMTRGAVPRILAAQGGDGHWEGRDRFYTAKYRGTVWQLLILAELGADGSDERVRRGCEAALRDAQDRLSGGFATDRARKRARKRSGGGSSEGDDDGGRGEGGGKGEGGAFGVEGGGASGEGGGLHSRVIPCLTGNLVFSLIRLGLLDDPRLQAAVDWLTTYARFDDGDGAAPGTVAGPHGDGVAPTGWPYDAWQMCWGRHSCHMGVVKTLKGLAEIPPQRRSPAVQRTLDDGVEFMLRHHVHKRSHDPARDSRPGWKRFGFPRMYQTDVLEILGILAKLGSAGDERAGAARALVAARADAQGRWKLQDTFNGRFVVDIETRGQPSRWVTLRALTALEAVRTGRPQASGALV